MQRVHDRVKETTAVTGTGPATLLGAVTAFQSFNGAGFVLGEPLYYAIVEQSGSAWEVGRGTLTSTNVLSRDTVFESSNANALVSFTGATCDVFSTIPAERIEELFTKGQSQQAILGNQML
jgi:hypothetical protein